MPEIALSRRRAGPVGARRALRGVAVLGASGLAALAVGVVVHDLVPSDDAGPVLRVAPPARTVTTTGDVGRRGSRAKAPGSEAQPADAPSSATPADVDVALVGTTLVTTGLTTDHPAGHPADHPAGAGAVRHDFGPTASGSGGVTRVVRLAVDDLASVLPALGGVGPGADALAACVDELLGGGGGTPPRSPCR